MTRIVTTTYRYKPPPKRKGRKLAEITGPAVVTAKGSRRPVLEEAAAEVNPGHVAHPRRACRAHPPPSPPANDDQANHAGSRYAEEVGDRHREEARGVVRRRARHDTGGARSPLPCAALRCFRRSPDGQ